MDYYSILLPQHYLSDAYLKNEVMFSSLNFINSKPAYFFQENIHQLTE